jgi:hypothetical protein
MLQIPSTDLWVRWNRAVSAWAGATGLVRSRSMTWFIFDSPIGGIEGTVERVLGAVDAANIDIARKRAEALFPNREFTLRESEFPPPSELTIRN